MRPYGSAPAGAAPVSGAFAGAPSVLDSGLPWAAVPSASTPLRDTAPSGSAADSRAARRPARDPGSSPETSGSSGRCDRQPLVSSTSGSAAEYRPGSAYRFSPARCSGVR
ncbi:hypothetical protein V2I01_22800 [Micromonospora sp. BRA006-A]|nr:hypothetical protein [Micromonospora sp. BRA006-A]